MSAAFVVLQEGGVRGLLDVCRRETLTFTRSQALRALATICCAPECIAEFERVRFGAINCHVVLHWVKSERLRCCFANCPVHFGGCSLRGYGFGYSWKGKVCQIVTVKCVVLF